MGGNLTTSTHGIIVKADEVVIIGEGNRLIGAGSEFGIMIEGYYNSSSRSWISPDNITIMKVTIENFTYGIYAYYLWTDDYSFTGLFVDYTEIYSCDEGIHLEYIYEPGGVIINNTKITNSSSYGLYVYELTYLYVSNTMVKGSGGVSNDYGYTLSILRVYTYTT